jgi:hypothetical protein
MILFFRITFVMSLAYILGACAGNTAIKESKTSAAFQKKLSTETLIVVESSHLQKAYLSNLAYSGGTAQAAHSAVQSSTNAIGNALVGLLKKEKVNAAFVVVNVANEPDAVGRAVQQYLQKNQILVINADAFPTIQYLQFGQPVGSPRWDAKIIWALRLYERNVLSQGLGEPAWSAKTNAVIFNHNACRIDNFKTCADRFSDTVISQMKHDLLLDK